MTYKVLFIGNSHTFFENLPWLLASLCKKAGVDIQVFMLTYPGADLDWHIKSYCALPNIRFGGYDYVVLQQRSHPFEGTEPLITQGLELCKAIKKAGSIPVLMNTWSEKNNPQGQKLIDEAFKELNRLCPDSLVAKCGQAWHSLRDSIDLYFIDGEHQNPRGAYLNACVLLKTIFGINPLSLDTELEDGILSKIPSRAEIRLLQETAAKI
jgi:hypothetical protein